MSHHSATNGKINGFSRAHSKQNHQTENKGAHERYLNLYKIVDITNRKMSLLFDGHSRSKAWLQLRAICGEGLADKNLVSKISEEFQQQTDPSR